MLTPLRTHSRSLTSLVALQLPHSTTCWGPGVMIAITLLVVGLLLPATAHAQSEVGCFPNDLVVQEVSPVQGSSTYTVQFRIGYPSPGCNTHVISFGSENHFVPSPGFRGQPTEFTPDENRYQFFTLTWDPAQTPTLTWHLYGHDATVTHLPAQGSPLLSVEKASGDPVMTVTDTQLRAEVPDGVRFTTDAENDLGVAVTPGGNSWTTASDSTKKHAYREADGERFLTEIRRMRLGSWSYKEQADSIRHYGPMAQDFFDAFGHDDIGTIGTDTTIASADADGVLFIAVQALEERTAALREENEALRARLDAIEQRRTYRATQERRPPDPSARAGTVMISILSRWAHAHRSLLIGLLLGGVLGVLIVRVRRP